MVLRWSLAVRRSRDPAVPPGLRAGRFVPAFLHFVAIRSRGWVAAPKVASTQRNTHKEPQMITAFFVFVTTAFFVAIVANVAESVSATRFA
jgi:hypothetical protein